MAVRAGSSFTIEVSDDGGTTWQFVEHATNWSGGGERQSQSFARFHNTAKIVLPGQSEYNYSFDMYFDDVDAGQEIIRTASLATTDEAAEIDIRVTRATGIGFTQTVRVGTVTDSVDPEGVQQQSVTLTGTDAPVPLP